MTLRTRHRSAPLAHLSAAGLALALTACPPLDTVPDGEPDPTPTDPTPADPTPTPADPTPTATPPELRAAALKAMGNELPGASMCLVVRGAVAWCDGFGTLDLAHPAPVTPDTPFLLASVSKLFTGTTLMALRDSHRVDLDAPLPAALPARHPVSGDPFTLRELLTHTAGIYDSDATDAFYDWDGDVALSLGDAVTGYLLPRGRWYSADDNFLGSAPGEVYEYSNMGIATAGYVVELASEGHRDLRAESARLIFAPLGMTHSFWRLADCPAGVVIASPHEPGEGGAPPHPVAHYTFADYPDGGLFSSARDLATFIAAMGRGGAPVLARATLREMMTPQVPDLEPTQGLVWYSEDRGGRTWWEHNGSETGVATQVMLDPATGSGLVVLGNGESDEDGGALDQLIDLAIARLAVLEGR